MIGGDILENKAFKYILSIGYELETNNLIKLTEITTDVDGNDIRMLLNTDSSQREINEILESNEEDDNSSNLRDKDYVYKRFEKLNLDVGKENVSFNITNDMATSQFIKNLHKKCVDYPDEDEDEEDELEDELEGGGEDEEDEDEAEDEDEDEDEDETDLESALSSETDLDSEDDLTSKKIEYKNQLYKYEITDKETGEPITYDINFLHGPENTGCSVFSDVEWVATYYKPKLHSNVILETFTDTIKILLEHLHSLIPNKGEFIYINPDTKKEQVIGDTELYHMPDTTLYYLKTNPGGIDTIFTTIQMTFSAKIADIYFIMKNLMEDNLHSYDNVSSQCAEQLKILNSIRFCTEKLIKSYNEKEPTYKIVTTDKLLMREIYNYIILLLYKLYVFYNTYRPLPQEIKEEKYFKSYLPFNIRHSNYQLYVELKRCLKIVFDTKLVGKSEAEQNEILANIIKKLFVQEPILFEYLLYNSNESLIRKNAFKINNILEPTNIKNYGDPYYSLVSYFDFFESVIDDTHDWFVYKKIDVNSTKMKIKDDLILVEFRLFPKQLKNYISSVLDVESRTEMDEMTKNTVGLLSFRTLEKFIKIYDQKQEGEQSVDPLEVAQKTIWNQEQRNVVGGSKLSKRVRKTVKKHRVRKTVKKHIVKKRKYTKKR